MIVNLPLIDSLQATFARDYQDAMAPGWGATGRLYTASGIVSAMTSRMMRREVGQRWRPSKKKSPSE
jgi:hypothetical protein